MTSPYYTPSGRIPLTAVPFTILCSLAALPAAWIYAWMETHVRVVFLNFFFAVAFAFWLGFVARHAAARAKVRNPRWMAKLAASIGLFAWYCQWAAWIAMAIHNQPGYSGQAGATSLIESFTQVAATPSLIASFMAELSKQGTWKIAGYTVSGGLLIAVWLAELALLLGIPHLFARIRAGEPFCEASNTWAEAVELQRKFAFIDEPHGVAQFLETHPERFISVLVPWTEDGPLSYSTVTVYRCRGGGDPYVSIKNTEATLVDGKVKETHKLVSDFLRIPGVDAEAVIRQAGDRVPSSSDPADPSELPVPPELLSAVEHLEADRHDAVLDAAAPYVTAAQATLRIDALRLCALANSRLNRWEESFSFWRRLFDEEPTAHNALQVATSSVMAGDVSHGVTWIAKSQEMNATSRELPGLLILTNFVTALTQCEQMNAALPYLDDIKQVYVNLRMTDPTFLYAHHVPLFNAFLDNSGPAIRVALGPEKGRAWYTSMLPHLDDNGRAELSEWLDNDFIQTTSQPGTA